MANALTEASCYRADDAAVYQEAGVHREIWLAGAWHPSLSRERRAAHEGGSECRSTALSVVSGPAPSEFQSEH